MKKTYLSLIATVFAISFSYAQWTTSGSNIYYNSGNVGIGTTSPSSIFQVAPASAYTAIGTGDGLTVYNPLISSVNLLIGLNGSTSNTIQSRAGTSSTWPLAINPFGGNVGIGTTSPVQKLTVNGSFSAAAGFSSYTPDGLFSANALPDFITTPAGSPAILFGYSDAGGGQYVPRIGFSAPYSSGHQVGTQASFGLEPVSGDFTIRGGATNAEQLRILNSNGNVGIGTTTPDQLLSVNGNVHAQEVLVNLTGFEDRVFKPTYHLLTLPEVKAYINQNHHLPDVPSEAEVIKNGLKLGDMDRLLTKKVEELTLYLIEKDKQIKEQQTVNQSQATQLNFQQKEIDELKKQVSTLIKAKQ